MPAIAVGYVVCGHYTARYLAALPRRILLVEQQASSAGPCEAVVLSTFTSHIGEEIGEDAAIMRS